MSKTVKWILGIGGVILLLFLGFTLWGWFSGWSYTVSGHMWPGMMDGFSGGWLMWLGMIVVVLLIFLGIMVLLQGNKSTDGASSHTTDSALEILKKRYASGELTKDEFEQRKKDLQ